MDKKTIAANIRKNLKQLRKKHNLSQRDIAQQLKISTSLYQKYELNDPTTPSLCILVKIADYYHITLDSLLNRTNFDLPQESITNTLLQTFATLSDTSRQELEQACITALTTYQSQQTKKEEYRILR